MSRPPRGLLVLGTMLVLAGCAREEPPPEAPRPVLMRQISLGTTAPLAVFAGDVRPRHEADLAFRISGKLVARNVDAGARVKKGAVLARIDPADVALQAEAARAALASAETEARFTESEHARYRDLFAQHFVSASALDQKRNAADTAAARVRQARAQLEVTRNQAAYATLVAESDGVITAVQAEPGQVVGAGQVVLRLAREDEREVAIAVPEQRLREIQDAAALSVVLLADRSRTYRAVVREIAPSVDPVTRTFAVRVRVPDADATLQWGMTANVVVQGRDRLPGALLPLTALYRSGEQPAVWIYDPRTQQVALQPVTIAAFREDGVLVGGGIVDGQWVVTAGVHKLAPGQKVRPYAPTEASDASGAAPAPRG